MSLCGAHIWLALRFLLVSGVTHHLCAEGTLASANIVALTSEVTPLKPDISHNCITWFGVGDDEKVTFYDFFKTTIKEVNRCDYCTAELIAVHVGVVYVAVECVIAVHVGVVYVDVECVIHCMAPALWCSETMFVCCLFVCLVHFCLFLHPTIQEWEHIMLYGFFSVLA